MNIDKFVFSMAPKKGSTKAAEDISPAAVPTVYLFLPTPRPRAPRCA